MHTIEKETIETLHFPREDVLIDKDQMRSRTQILNECLMLGNDYHHKVRIVFEDVEGEKMVETTIWGLTDYEVILKKNVILPINRIKSINTI